MKFRSIGRPEQILATVKIQYFNQERTYQMNLEHLKELFAELDYDESIELDGGSCGRPIPGLPWPGKLGGSGC